MKIYKITNLRNGKVYIGQTIQSLKDRWKNHKGCSYNRPLYNSIRKHGSDNFTIELLETCNTIQELNDRETFWVSHFKSNDKNFGYNLTTGGNRGIRNKEVRSRGMTGKNHREESKKKIGNANRGSKNGMFGKQIILSKEQIEKNTKAMIASETFQSSRKSLEYRRKIATIQNNGGWVLLDANYNLIKEFDTRMDVVDHLGCSSVNVKKARAQNRILCKHFRVMYKSDYSKIDFL